MNIAVATALAEAANRILNDESEDSIGVDTMVEAMSDGMSVTVETHDPSRDLFAEDGRINPYSDGASRGPVGLPATRAKMRAEAAVVEASQNFVSKIVEELL